jgi:hypothetical protein
MDSETLTEKNKKKKKYKKNCNSDFPSIGMDILKKTNFKVAFFLFIMGIFIFSDVFIENILSIKYRDGNCATTTGTMIQLLFFVLFYLIIDLLITGELL